ncbi:MAG: protein phosphatase 2C domain-containing protein [Caldilineaceae bacterium]|nr:protein phosphatase 2C domain-containing protein [Caldilineaceae bacterium]
MKTTHTTGPITDPASDQTTEPWRRVGASVIGVKHQRDGKPCQDYFGYQALPGGALVVAVADGAGSAPCAQAGSQLVVEQALATIQVAWQRYRPASRKAWRHLIMQAFQTAQQQVKQVATAAGRTPRDYAATLLLAILTEDLLVCGLVGDCAIVAALGNEIYQSLCPPQRGEYANATYFATHHNLAQRLDIQLLEQPIEALALFSDGLLNLALNIGENQPYTPFFTPLFAFAREATDEGQTVQALTEFLNSERVNQRTHDDKTLVLITRAALTP